MAHDVFISHSSKDKVIADAICAGLETRGIRCWIAPRDILPGIEWTKSIVDAIADCKVFLLVFSENSNKSTQAIKEVDCAVNHEKTILPFRVEDIKATGSMEYHLAGLHWMDAISPPLENHIEKLAQYISRITGILLQKSGETPVVIPQPVIKLNPKTSPPVQTNATPVKTQKRARLMWLWIGGDAVVLAALLLGVILLKDRLFPKQAETGEVLLTVTDAPAIVASPFPTFTLFATVTAKPQGPTAPPTMKAATSSPLMGMMTANANCWETASEGSNNAKILQAGDNVTILGKSPDGNWYNLEFVNKTQQNYCNSTNLVTDCWLKIDNNITLKGPTEPLPVFTPRPAALAWWFGELSCTNADGTGGYNGDYDNVNYNVLVNQLNSLVSQYQKNGTTCTYRVFKACK